MDQSEPSDSRILLPITVGIKFWIFVQFRLDQIPSNVFSCCHYIYLVLCVCFFSMRTFFSLNICHEPTPSLMTKRNEFKQATIEKIYSTLYKEANLSL